MPEIESPTTDESTFDDEGAVDAERVMLRRDDIKKLEDSARLGKEAQKELGSARDEAESAKRELAFIKAGVDTDARIGKLLMSAYDGDLTPEAIQAAATEVGALRDGTPLAASEGPALSDAETQLSDNRRGLAVGGTAPADGPQNQEDPKVASFNAAQERLREGGTREQAIGTLFGERMAAANRGDNRVIVE